MPVELIPSTTVASPDERFPYAVRNVGDQWLSFGLVYRIQRLVERGWEDVPLDYAFRLPLLSLGPGDSRELNVWVPARTHAGHHRLAQEFTESPDRTPQGRLAGTRLSAGFEFDVTAG